jgi:ribosomal-protein-alanine N-acetyltransferase
VNFQLLTERFTLRPLGDGDTLELHTLWTSEGVRRYLWDGEIVSLERTRNTIERSEQLFRELGFGLWGARDTATNVLSGFTGFWYFRDPPELELLYGVADHLCGRGIASEIAAVVTQYGERTLGMETIAASTDVANAASVRVLEKLGFRRTRQATVNGLETVFYRRG